tara:strand:+ start:3561 stop:4400 length:840 start_codon:yes stop_codon:yes gene_type:complete
MRLSDKGIHKDCQHIHQDIHQDIHILDKMFDKISNDKNWINIYKDEFVNLKNPYSYHEYMFLIKDLYDLIIKLKDNYIEVVRILKVLQKKYTETSILPEDIQLCFDKMLSLKGHHFILKGCEEFQVKSISLVPYIHSVPCRQLNWVSLYTQNTEIPNKFEIKWDLEIFDTVQLLISDNFPFEIILDKTVKSKKLKLKNQILILYEKFLNPSLHGVVKLKLKCNEHTNVKTYNSIFSLKMCMSQYKYHFNVGKIIENIDIFNEGILELNDTQNLLEKRFL